MTSGIYDRFKANLFNKVVDMEADTVIVMLLNNSHGFTTTHNVLADVSANELATAGGYTQQDKELAGKAVTQSATMKWDGTDVSWTSATFTAYHCVLYDETAAGNLICSIDFGGAKSVSAGTFTIQWHANGIITLATA